MRTPPFKTLLAPFFEENGARLQPATEDQLAHFRHVAEERGVPDEVIATLVEFYEVTNGIDPCLDGFSFHSCTDETLFEWWWDFRDLWLGGRDIAVLRWSGGKYCLGSACDVSDGPESEFETLAELVMRTLTLYS